MGVTSAARIQRITQRTRKTRVRRERMTQNYERLIFFLFKISRD